MGLRVIAQMYDRSEALVMININPYHEIAYDGYKIIVCDDDFQSAIAVLTEARAKPLFEGERLSKQHIIVPHLIATFLLGWLWVWAIPLRRYTWHRV